MTEKTAQKEPGKKPVPSKKPKPQQEVVVQIPLSELHPFPDHPFQVREDASMQETAESVKEYGVLVPALARPREDGGYELIAGHRRKHACELAGLATMPVIIRDIDRDAATIIMVDSNLQRENILPSERAKAYKMKMEAIKRQGARTDLTSPKISAKFRSDDEVGQDAGVSGDTIRNYIALTQLVPELQQMVDEKKIALSPAYQLAALTPKEQGQLLETIDSEQTTPSLSQAQRMKKLSQSGELNEDTMLSMPIDMVLSADTGMEFPEMYEHLAKLDEHLFRERGIHITTLRHPKGFEYLMFDEPKQKPRSLENRARLGIPPYGNGWPGIRVRWCTGQLKTHLITKEVNRLKGELGAIHYVGIAADEAWRCKDERYPLVEWGITEAQALQACYDRGFDFGGLYEIYHRASCWCCPFQRIEIKKTSNPGTELTKVFSLLDKASVPRGKGAIVCIRRLAFVPPYFVFCSISFRCGGLSIERNQKPLAPKITLVATHHDRQKQVEVKRSSCVNPHEIRLFSGCPYYFTLPMDGNHHPFAKHLRQPCKERRSFGMDVHHIVFSKCTVKCCKSRGAYRCQTP